MDDASVGPAARDRARSMPSAAGTLAHCGRRRIDRRTRPLAGTASVPAGAGWCRRLGGRGVVDVERRAPTVGCRQRPLAGLGSTGAVATIRPMPTPPVSIRISGDPTDRTSPRLRRPTAPRPTTGDGISTVALSVITSTITWSSATVSPTLTCHATISASAMPSPTSGSLTTYSPIVSPPSLVGARRRRGRAREVVPLLRMRIGRVPAGDALDRRFEAIEAELLHQSPTARRRSRWCASLRARSRSGRSC